MNKITSIQATTDLYNGGRCFTKGKTYYVTGHLTNTYQLLERSTVNDMGEPHIIGVFYRHFKIVKRAFSMYEPSKNS